MANVASHPDPERLRQFGLGQLPAGEALRVESHVAACDLCTAALQQVQDDSLVALLSRKGVGGEPPQFPSVAPVQPGEAETAPTRIPTVHDAGAGGGEPDLIPLPLRGHPRYRVLRLLGRGGLGEVYLAVHQHLGRSVALKVIRPTLLGDAAAVERFRREMQAVARLAHPNIVQAHDADQAGELHFLVMEYVEGQSLHDYLEERGPLPVAEACDFMRQAALGLQHAFERGMTHRDVKPHNLMRTATGLIKVLDFGLARLIGKPDSDTALTEIGVVMGTADYLAPEQARNAASADIRSDVYSLGCTLYHLLTGAPPHPGGSSLEKIHKHAGAEPAPLAAVRADLPAGLAAVAARMLARNPADRYQTPAEAAAALEPFSRPSGVRSSTTGVATHGRRLLVVLALLLIFGGVAAVAFLGKQNRNQATPREATAREKEEPDPRPRAPIEQRPAAPRRLEVMRRLPWPGRKDFGTEFSNDGRWCAAFGEDAFRVWDVETGKVVQEVAGQSPIGSVCFLHDDKQVLSSHKDSVFRCWDVATGQLLSQHQAAPPRGAILGVGPTGDCFASNGEQVAFVWDLQTGKERFRVTAIRPKSGVLLNSAPLSPDGRRLLTVDHFGFEGGLARIFDARTGKLLQSIPTQLMPDNQAWSADSRRIYLNTGDPELNQSFLVCFDADSGKKISQTRLDPSLHSSWGRRFSRDVRWFGALYPGERLLHIYDARKGFLVYTAREAFLPWSLSFAPDGRYAACAVRGEVLVYRL